MCRGSHLLSGRSTAAPFSSSSRKWRSDTYVTTPNPISFALFHGLIKITRCSRFAGRIQIAERPWHYTARHFNSGSSIAGR